MDLKVQKVMDRDKVAESIHAILDAGIDLLGKKKLESTDHGKLKVMRTMGTHVNNAVFMVQQETAQQRCAIILERMKQLGFEEKKQIKD